MTAVPKAEALGYNECLRHSVSPSGLKSLLLGVFVDLEMAGESLN